MDWKHGNNRYSWVWEAMEESHYKIFIRFINKNIFCKCLIKSVFKINTYSSFDLNQIIPGMAKLYYFITDISPSV